MKGLLSVVAACITLAYSAGRGAAHGNSVQQVRWGGR